MDRPPSAVEDDEGQTIRSSRDHQNRREARLIMPHPSEYGNGGRPTLADVRSGAATYQDYIARLGEEQPPAAEPSTPRRRA
jgi:hypothetical protein